MVREVATESDTSARQFVCLLDELLGVRSRSLRLDQRRFRVFQWFVATIATLVMGVVVAVAAVRALGAPGAAC
jgi:hypothetical protein